MPVCPLTRLWTWGFALHGTHWGQNVTGVKEARTARGESREGEESSRVPSAGLFSFIGKRRLPFSKPGKHEADGTTLQGSDGWSIKHTVEGKQPPASPAPPSWYLASKTNSTSKAQQPRCMMPGGEHSDLITLTGAMEAGVANTKANSS